MSDVAVVCPHCGARQKDRDPLPGQRELDKKAGRPVSANTGPEPVLPKPALEGLSTAEVGALLATDVKAGRRIGQGPIATMILPHPNTTGVVRLAELALTVAAFPLAIAGAALVGFARRGRHATKPAPGPAAELTGVVIALGPGGLGFYQALALLEVADPLHYVIACGAAVIGRAALRLTARRGR